MLEDKQGTPTEPGTPQEKAGVEGDAQPQELSVEELKAKAVELTAEVGRKEAVIKQLQGVTQSLQKRGVPKEEMDALHKRLDGVEESQADLKDILTKHYGEDDETATVKKTHRQQLDERRVKEKSAPPMDPDVRRFIDYVNDQKLEQDDPRVVEAIAGDKSPKEALAHLKDLVAREAQGATDKQVADAVRIGVERELKERGITGSGIESPSAPTKDMSSMNADEKLAEGFNQIKKQGKK